MGARGSYRPKAKKYRGKYSKRHRKAQALKLFLIDIVAIMAVIGIIFLAVKLFSEPEKKITASEESVAAFNIAYSSLSQIREYADKNNMNFAEMLTVYSAENDFFTGVPIAHDLIWLEENFFSKYDDIKNGYDKKSLKPYSEMFDSLLGEIKYFPVKGGISGEDYIYSNSWGALREYGGERTHKGTDIIDRDNIRGRLSIISMTDGVVENIGWNELGGYRVGIRSDSGTYYYYAHLAEFTKGLEKGSKIKAGDLIGLMGDTGYSTKEGTTGNFVVHLHIGISPNVKFSKSEFWINPYVFLRNIEYSPES